VEASGIRKSRFTLVEVLAVVAIIMFILGIMIAGYAIAQKSAARAKTKSVIQALATALEGYKAKMGYYPSQPNGMEFAIPPKPSGSELDFSDLIPYAKWKKNGTLKPCSNSRSLLNGKDVVYDAYGTPIWYRCPGYHNRSSFDLESAGPDGWLYVENASWDKRYNPPSDASSHAYNKDGVGLDNIRNW
jgi:type II secretory pathway pseudopilin PulG